MTRLLNQMAFITALCACCGTLVALLSGLTSYVYLSMGLGLTLNYAIIIVLNAYDKSGWSRFYLCAFMPTWFNFGVLLGGGGFGENIAIAATLAITYVIYT